MRKSAAILTAMFAAIIFIYSLSCSNEPKTATEPEAAKPNEDSIKNVVDRGEYLVKHVAICLDCHSKRDESRLGMPVVAGTEGGGGNLFDPKTDQMPGVIYSRNITPDVETGIGGWTDDEILKAVTQGISKNGDTLFPIMPYINYNKMPKQDLLSIIAFIRTLKPIKNKIPERKLFIPISAAYPKDLKKEIDTTPPPFNDQVAYGRYLTSIASCADCHTPMEKGQFDFSRVFAGGYTFNPSTFKVNSANITPDSATGIGTWTEERFLNKFIPYRKEEAYSQNPGKQNTMMPVVAYAGMEDNDLKAIYAFLRTVPPVNHKVEKYPK